MLCTKKHSKETIGFAVYLLRQLFLSASELSTALQVPWGVLHVCFLPPGYIIHVFYPGVYRTCISFRQNQKRHFRACTIPALYSPCSHPHRISPPTDISRPTHTSVTNFARVSTRSLARRYSTADASSPAACAKSSPYRHAGPPPGNPQTRGK